MLSSLFQFSGSVRTTQGMQQDVLTQAHSPSGFRRGTFDTADKRELSAHRPEWKVLFGDHTDTHTEFQLSTASARVTIFSLSPKMNTKKETTSIIFCRLQRPITTYTMCSKKNQ